jgi:PAS domain S-box-containing protein
MKSDFYEEKFLQSVDSLFDAFFLISEENQVLQYSIKDEHIKLYFGEGNLEKKDIINLLTSKEQKERIDELIQRILVKESSKLECILLVNDKIRFYEIFICTLSTNQILITLTNIDHRKKIEFELAEERSTLKNIIDLNPYAIEIKDSEGRHVSANKAFIDMFKSVAPPEYSIFEDPHLEERGLLDNILKLKEGKVVKMGEHWYDVRDSAIAAGFNLDDYPSSPICHKAVAFPIMDNEGKIKNYVMMHEDITKQKKAEQKLEESEEMYRHFFNSTPYAIWLVNLQGKIIDCNKTMNSFMSILKPTDVIGKSYTDVIKMFLQEVNPKFKHLGNIFREGFKTLLQKGYLDPIEVEMPRKDGKTAWITLESSIVNAGKEKLFQVFIKDITKRKTTEQKLEESEKMYRHLFNSTPYAVWLVNLQGKVIDCNKTMNNFMSVFKHTDLIGKSFREVIKMFLREGDPRFESLDHVLQERFKILINRGHLEPLDFEISRGDGKTFWIALESSFVNLGKETLIQVFIRDITEKKLAEIELEELRKDLENRVKERTIKLENSEKKYRKAYNRANLFKGLFTHDISNMFHTIGNSIDLCDTLLKQEIKNINMLDYFGTIEQQINRGKKLIKNIRNLSEIEESEMPLIPIEILEKLRSAVQFVKVNFQGREINVKIDSKLDPIYVFANDLLLDVFENILINSVSYNKNDIIEIEIIISSLINNEIEHLQIEFKDNGVGINDSRKETIFKEKYRKKTESNGMGLGLSLVAKLLDLCEGKIWVEDRIKGDYTQGSNFVILIPMVKKI